jgi:hypothetical protein
MATENPQGLYEVGSGKPPKSTPFQKGKGGNLGGRSLGLLGSIRTAKTSQLLSMSLKTRKAANLAALTYCNN